MTSFRRRIVLLALPAFLFVGMYAAARRHAPAIIAFVVEHALIQKAPVDIAPEEAQRRFEAWFRTVKQEDKMRKLLDLSKYLEKVQRLTPVEMEQLLQESAPGPRPGF